MRRDARRRAYSRRRKRSMKETSKEVHAHAGKSDEAAGKLAQAYQAIDKAAKRGVIHKNTAARKKSRLARALAQRQ